MSKLELKHKPKDEPKKGPQIFYSEKYYDDVYEYR